jgi:voltage-gated potassium channel
MTGSHGQARRAISGVPPLLDSYAVSGSRRRKTVRRSFSAHYIICGHAERARRLASEITRRSLPFVVVSDDPEELVAVRESGAPHVAGSPAEGKVLEEAGLHYAKAVVAAAERDSVNALTVMTARMLSSSVQIIALSDDERNRAKLRRAGADRVIWDRSSDSHELLAAVLAPSLLDLVGHMLRSGESGPRAGTIEICLGSRRGGETLGGIGVHQPTGLFVLAVRRDGEVVALAPGSDFAVQDGDQLLTVGTLAEMDNAEHRWCPLPSPERAKSGDPDR